MFQAEVCLWADPVCELHRVRIRAKLVLYVLPVVVATADFVSFAVRVHNVCALVEPSIEVSTAI